MKKNSIVAAGLAATLMASAPVWGFSFDDIHYWVGEGTNKCAVVVDFNDGGDGNRSFAWGYRWNGAAPSMKAILDEITARDQRLKMFASVSQYGSFIDAFAYDADGDGGTFERVWNSATYAYDHVKSDDDDIFSVLESDSGVDATTGNYIYSGTSWMQLAGTGTAFEDVAFAETPNGVDLTNPENGDWICWRICPYVSEYDAEWNPVSYECIATSANIPVAAVRAFGMEDIQSWLGHGTNSCAIVVDFNDGSVEPCSFAWGYRWNGEAPSVKAILDEITAQDQRLKMFASVGQYGSFIDAFAYDADGDGGTFERVWNSATYAYDHIKSDEDDLFPVPESYSDVDGATGNYVYSGTSWMQLAGTGDVFIDVAFAETPNGVDFTIPENGQWICWRICEYISEYDTNWEPVAYECDTSSTHLPKAAEPRLAASGTVTKSKTKTGQTATWKAAAATGSVFSHWEGAFVKTLGLSANTLRNPTLKFKMPAELEEPTAVFVPIDSDGISALWLEGDQPLKAGVLVTNLFLRDDSLSYVTATVKGLPSGMKFNAADLSFGGTPKKEGTYVLTVTAKNASGYQMSQAIKLSVGVEDPSVNVPEIASTPYYPLTLTVADGGGTVKGTGVYAADKVVTARAVADKGFVFAGWFTDETCAVPATVGDLDYRTPTVKVRIPDVRYLVAKFVRKGVETDPVADLACDALDETGTLTMMVGVRAEASISCDSPSLPRYAAKSLPSGVSISKTTGEIVGVPTKAGTFKAMVTVSNASGKRSLPIAINVLPMPAWAIGSFVGLAEQQDVEPGFATLTVGKTGKISGKVELGGTNWTFSATGYDSFQFGEGSTNLTITGKAKSAGAKKNASSREFAFSVNAPTNGVWNSSTVTGTFGDADYGAYRVFWADSKSAKNELAANWTGTYQYSTDDGDVLTMKIQNSGAVKFAGTLANGRSVKGSTSLLHEDAALIRSPFAIAYAPPATVKVKDGKKTVNVPCPAFCDIITFKYEAPEPGGPAVRR